MRRFPLNSLALWGLLSFSLVSLGCCGPLACGPAGCHGPLSVAAPACGGCGDCQGCGELYLDPWVNEPAACHDPCDSCGNYNGQSCHACRPVLSGIATLWGYRYDGGCGCGPHEPACDAHAVGCDSYHGEAGCDCGGGHAVASPPMTLEEGTILYDHPQAEPLPAPEPTPAEAADENDAALRDSHIPNRSQPIFRRRANGQRSRF